MAEEANVQLYQSQVKVCDNGGIYRKRSGSAIFETFDYKSACD